MKGNAFLFALSGLLTCLQTLILAISCLTSHLEIVQNPKRHYSILLCLLTMPYFTVLYYSVLVQQCTMPNFTLHHWPFTCSMTILSSPLLKTQWKVRLEEGWADTL